MRETYSVAKLRIARPEAIHDIFLYGSVVIFWMDVIECVANAERLPRGESDACLVHGIAFLPGYDATQRGASEMV